MIFPRINIFPGWLRDGAPEYLLRWNDAPCNGNKRFACESKFFLYNFPDTTLQLDILSDKKLTNISFRAKTNLLNSTRNLFQKLKKIKRRHS